MQEIFITEKNILTNRLTYDFRSLAKNLLACFAKGLRVYNFTCLPTLGRKFKIELQRIIDLKVLFISAQKNTSDRNQKGTRWEFTAIMLSRSEAVTKLRFSA